MKCRHILLTSLRITYVYYPSLTTRRCDWSSVKKNPYEVLELKNNCSMQDIKKAYIRLCKKLHPDMKPGDSSQHKKFVELNNAYTTLVNVESRRQFDHKYSENSSNEDFDWKHKQTYNPFNQETEEKYKSWYEREEYRQYYHQPHSINTTNNFNVTWTLVGCFFLVIIGSILTYSAYRFGTQYTLNRVDKRSKEISENYNDVRKNALGSSREQKVEEMKKKWNL